MDSFFEKKLITTKDASELSGYTSDYLGRLVRLGKIEGQRIGHNWLIESESLEIFLKNQKTQKSEYARSLSRAREEEYRTHHSLLRRTRKLSPVPLQGGIRKSSAFSQFFALTAALFVVVSSAFAAQALALPRLGERAAELAHEVAFGFRATFGGIPYGIVERIDATNASMRATNARVAADTALASARVASPILSESDSSLLQNVFPTGIAHPAALALVPSESEPVRISPLAFADVQSSVLGAYALLTSPTRLADALTGAYTALGTHAYDAITASFAAYRSLIVSSGPGALAFGVSVRDMLAKAPRAVNGMNLAFGESIIHATHAAIRVDVAAAYGFATAAPASARATVAFVGGIGDTLAGATARTPALATTVFLRTTQIPATLAPEVAQTVFSGEYAAATRFVAITSSISKNYLALVSGTGTLAYSGTAGALALANLTPPLFARAPAAIENAYLGLLGNGALVLDVLPSHLAGLVSVKAKDVPILAAVLPALSAGEQVALFTYQTIYGFFNSATGALAGLFGTPNVTVVSNPPSVALPFATSTTPASAPSPAAPARTERIAVTNYPTYTTVVQGVSQDFVNQSLASLRASILTTVAGMIQPVAAQGVTNENTIQYVNMIQDLSNLTVRNGNFLGGTFSGGNLTNGISVSAGAGSFTHLTGGTTSLATTSISGALTTTGDVTLGGTLTAGSLSVSSIASGGAISAPYFTATSSAATSTFSSSLNVGNGGFVYATSTRNVGIGVLSPAALLALQNSTSTQPIFVASNAAGAEVYRITNNGFVGIGTTSPTYALSVEGSSSLGNNAIAGYFTATSSTATSTFGGSLAVGTSTQFANGLFAVGTSSPLLYVDSTTGRIGIGTSSPAVALDIFATDAMRLPVGTTAQRPLVGDTGYVRYNTTTQQFEGYGANGVWQGLGGVIDANQDTKITADTNNLNEDYLRFFTDGVQRMTITNTGLIGIGSTSPFAQLSLAGGAGSTTALFAISTSTALFATATALTIDANGNLSLLNGANLSVGGALTVGGNTTLANATTTNLFSTTASSTNLFASNAQFGSLTANSLALTNALPVTSGGTGWSSIQSGTIPYGNGTSALATTTAGVAGNILALLNGIPTWTATTTFSSGLAYANGNVTNTGVLSLAQTYGTPQTGALTFATSTQSFNGLTLGTSLTNTGGAFTFTPSFSGTLNNSGLTNSTIALLTGSSGTDVNVSGSPASLGGTLTLNIPTASATNRGALSPTDWSTFNSKQSAISGTTGQFPYFSGTNTLTATSSLFLATSGNVGIGTTNPTRKLEVNGDFRAYGASQGLYTSTNSTYSAPSILSDSTQTLAINPNGNEVIVGGNGSDYPAQLAIRQTNTNDLFSVENAAGNSGLFIIKNTGNVGIGTVTPAQKLDVAGNINTSAGSAYMYNGSNVITASTTLQNYFFGGAGNLTMTGNQNTANGLNALSSNTTGFFNTANGSQALFFNTTGALNTANGLQALFSNTTGGSNTATGFKALNYNTTGNYNTATGFEALQYNTTGSYNTASGQSALYYNQSATSSVAIGVSAAQGTAAYSNQGGTYVGFQSGYSAATGSNFNTLLGYQSGYDITTGTNNVILGTEQTTGGGITTGTNNILIGTGVRSGLTPTASNQLNIGNLIFATGLGSEATASTGNVGIGTTSPADKLQIVGGGIILDNARFYQAKLSSGSVQPLIGDASNDYTQVVGNQGIGLLTNGAVLVAPQGTLSSPINTQLYVLPTDTSHIGIVVRGVASGTDLQQWQNSTGAVLVNVTNSGNVGIGTTSPFAPLSVNGNAFIGGNLTVNGLTATTSISAPYFTATNALATSTFAGGFQVAGTSGLTVLQNGNVGIGTTIPGYPLDIVGNNGSQIRLQGGNSGIFSTGNLYLDASGGGNVYLRTAGYTAALTVNTGNVGIGTVTPAQKLDVAGNINTSAGSAYMYNGSNVITASTTLNNYFFGGAGNLTMTGNQNIAFGPQALSSNTSGNNNIALGYQALYFNTTGYQNTALGYQTLRSNTTGALNTAIGYQALSSNSTGNYNVASGYQALINNTTGSNNSANGTQALTNNTTGSDNVASGYSALGFNTTGNKNIAIGSSALGGNTSGYNNIGIGFDTLLSNAGTDNIGIGNYALFNNTTGAYNIANGEYALRNNTTGSNNIADGYSSLYSNTTGTNNISTGEYTLWYNTTGSQNTATGLYSLYNNTTGSNNSATGYHALYSNQSATSSVALGYQAAAGTALYSNQGGTYLGFQSGYSASTGSNFNTLLGYQSGYDITTGASNVILGTEQTTGSGITTGSNNILIGTGVRSGLTPTASNQLNIGNLIFATGLGSEATASTGNVGIGTTSPMANLSIQGTSGQTSPIFAIATSSGAAVSLNVDSTGNLNFGNGNFNFYRGPIGSADNLQFQPTNVDGMFGITTAGNGSLEFITPYTQLRMFGGNGNTDSSNFDLRGNPLSTANFNFMTLTPNPTASSGVNTFLDINGVLNQSGSAGYTALLIQPTETTLGSGNKYLLEAGTSTAPNLFSVTDTGQGYFAANVGIGTASPAQKLDVAGNINTSAGSAYMYNGANVITASTTLSNYFFGGAGNLTMTGNLNIASGLNALKNNTTGYFNLATGANALSSNTTGYYNVANGIQALYNNTTGFDNIATGYAALDSNTTGSHNIATGFYALLNNTTGFDNIASGEHALWNNTTGSYNTALGGYALPSNTTGTNNTASGYGTLSSNTTGTNNTANGMYALYNNASATSSVALGYGAGQGTAAYSNQGGTYLGFQSGYSAATGSNFNTLLGYQSGYDITTGTNNILIGTGVRSGLTPTGSNQLNIGNLIFATGLGSEATASTGNVGIGTTNPGARLDVQGGNILANSNYSTGGAALGATSAGTELKLNGSGYHHYSILNSLGNLDIGTADGSPSLGANQVTQLTILGSSGNVGIGTTSPASSLAVSGGASVGADYNTVAPTNGLIVEGNVGIGTTSPIAKLSVQSDGASGPAATFMNSGTGSNQFAIYPYQDGNTYLQHNGNVVFSPIFSTTPQLVVSSTGNVGIGTVSPAQKLDVAGNINTSAGSAYMYNGSNVITASTTLSNYLFGPAGNLTMTGTNNTASGEGALQANTTGYNNTANGMNTLFSNSTGYSNLADGYDALFSNTSGYQNAASGMSALYNNTTGTANTAAGYAALYNNNNGINNTANGMNALYANITGSNNTALGMSAGRFIAGGVTNNAGSSNSLYLGYGTQALANGDTNEIVIGASATGNGSNSATLGNTSITKTILQGNVGIGTTSPAYKLDVAGFVNTDQYSGYKQAGNTILYASTTNQALAVGASGAAAWMATSSSLTYSVAVGQGALQTSPTSVTAQYNTAVGVSALSANLTGYDNTATGYQALTANTTGNYNTAHGMSALHNNTTGIQNTASGYQALYSNITNSNNVAYGYQALYSNITDQNMAVGYQALYSNTTGFQNTALGYQALDFNTTGSYNTATGYNALKFTTGNNNTATGFQALVFNSSGSSNTAGGMYALYNNTTGNNNTATGYGALHSNTAGTNNTTLGYQSGYSVTGSNNTTLGYQSGYDITTGANNVILGTEQTTGGGITTGTNNILIGTGVRSGLTPTASNQLNIGNLIFATGLGSENTLSTGNVGIGTTTPPVKLTVGTSANGGYALDSNEIFQFNGVNSSAYGTIRNGTDIVYLGLTSSEGLIGTQSALPFSLRTNAVDRLTINALNGNVGIGTASPAQKLDVAGNINTSAGSAYMYNGSNVITASTTLNNYFFGPAGNLTMTGNYNIAFGYGAFLSNTTGAANIAIDGYALSSNTTGSSNLATGYGTLNFNTTGSQNIAVGQDALQYNTTGNNNTAIGFQTLWKNTTGTNNTATGIYALQNNASATSSVAFGAGAAQGTANYSNQGGTYVGFQSGYSAATGSNFNTLLGYQSGYDITTGTNNVILGTEQTTGGGNHDGEQQHPHRHRCPLRPHPNRLQPTQHRQPHLCHRPRV